MMRVFINILAISLLLGSCSIKDRDLDGRWKSTFISPDFESESNVYFKDFDLFEKSIFEPIVFISGDSLRYDLGFGIKSLQFQENYANIIVKEGKVKIRSGKHIEIFDISYTTDQSFCLSKNEKKLACFTELDNILNEACESYSIDLRVINEEYDILLKISPLKGLIIRSGLKSDTTNFKITGSDEKYIRMLVNSINDETFNPKTEIIGGDYSVYEIKLKCGNKIYEGKSLGLKGVSFELRALLTNLENYIGTKFS